MTGAVREYTEYFDLELPAFDFPSWHVYYDRNIKTIDSILYLMTGSDNLKGIWKNSRDYLIGDLVVDIDVAFAFECHVAHKSAPAPTLFATDRANHPTYWHPVDFIHSLSGTSTTSVAIGLGNKTFQTQTGRIFSAGSKIIVNYGGDPVNTYMWGSVVSYSGAELVVDVDVIGGSGTYADWLITVSGERGPQGIQGEVGPQGEIGFIGPVGPQGPTGEQGIIEEPPATGATYGRTNDAVDGGSWIVVAATSADVLPTTPAGDLSSTTVQAALNELDNEKVAKSGSTMTGRLILSEDPAHVLGAVTKQYADRGSDNKLSVSGGTMTGNLTIAKASPAIILDKASSGQNCVVAGYRSGLPRWLIEIGDTGSETGGNAGSNFNINRYDDAGNGLGAPFSINRQNGITYLGGLHVYAGTQLNGLSCANDVYAYRPNALTTGVYYFGQGGNGGGSYLYYDGTNFNLRGGQLKCGAITTEGNSIICGALTASVSVLGIASGTSFLSNAITCDWSDGFRHSVPNGHNARTIQTVSGVRSWSAGCWYDGHWRITDESAGAIRFTLHYHDNSAHFSGPVHASSFNGAFNGKATSAGYADSAGYANSAGGITGGGSIDVSSIEGPYFIDLRYPGHGEDYCARIIVEADHRLRLLSNELRVESTQHAKGYKTRDGVNRNEGGNHFNFDYAGAVRCHIDDTTMGFIQMYSDYRIKADVVDLPSKWDTVKQLRPISFKQSDWTPPWEEENRKARAKDGKITPFIAASDKEHWGFIAHELQATLIETAANGYKDIQGEIQSPNQWTIIAALTSALQEAMSRIEALEATGATRK
jgi:hypothetical protein